MFSGAPPHNFYKLSLHQVLHVYRLLPVTYLPHPSCVYHGCEQCQSQVSPTKQEPSKAMLAELLLAAAAPLIPLPSQTSHWIKRARSYAGIFLNLCCVALTSASILLKPSFSHFYLHKSTCRIVWLIRSKL